MSWRVGSFVVFVLLAPSASARAETAATAPPTTSAPPTTTAESAPITSEPRPKDTSTAASERSHFITVRAGGIGFGTYAPRSVETHIGGGGGIVLGVSEHFDVEASAFFLHAPDDDRLPIQLLVRRTFFVSRVVRPYVGVGARFTHLFGAGATNLGGAVTSYGTYLWASDRVGAFAEANAAASFRDSKVIPELGALAGVALGF